MLFNSLEFAIFFPIVVLLYFLLEQKWRTPLLLVASCVFYMAFIPIYILILGATILIDYVAGIFLEKANGKARKRVLWGSIIATCLVLFAFKYFYFFTDSMIGLAGVFGWQLTGPSIKIILPIGLSFHTFQSLSYVVEVYRGRQKSERNFLTYATYVMFFPQLVAGPIERPQNLLHQFGEKHDFDYDQVVSGLKRMAWGFFKKLVVADRLALYVNDVYGNPQDFNGLQITIATVFFAYQIYCDFSGYSDIAIGSARVMGFKLMENFDSPYRACSISEFWHRWHISLSSWFRDYVYIPLGGNKVAKSRWYLNLLVVFGLSGLWHGANWTFVVWGGLNGAYLISSILTKPIRDRAWQILGVSGGGIIRSFAGMACTFFLVCVAWVIFRAENLTDVAYIYGNFWKGWNLSQISTPNFLLRQIPAAVAGILLVEMVQFVQAKYEWRPRFRSFPTPLRWAAYLCFFFLTVMFGIYHESQFIYFQF